MSATGSLELLHIVTQAFSQEAFDTEERAADLIFARTPSAGHPLNRVALAHPST
jgi:hypothetical protein